MGLQAKLDAYKAAFEEKAPPRVLDIMHRVSAELRRSNLSERVLKVGDRAPDFTLENARGAEISTRELRGQGPLVLGFYRGKW